LKKSRKERTKQSVRIALTFMVTFSLGLIYNHYFKPKQKHEIIIHDIKTISWSDSLDSKIDTLNSNYDSTVKAN